MVEPNGLFHTSEELVQLGHDVTLFASGEGGAFVRSFRSETAPVLRIATYFPVQRRPN
jgi:hypothetical protein